MTAGPLHHFDTVLLQKDGIYGDDDVLALAQFPEILPVVKKQAQKDGI